MDQGLAAAAMADKAKVLGMEDPEYNKSVKCLADAEVALPATTQEACAERSVEKHGEEYASCPSDEIDSSLDKLWGAAMSPPLRSLLALEVVGTGRGTS